MLKNLLLTSRIEGFIKSYKIIGHDRSVGKYQNVFTVEVDINNWYEFLRKLDDGHLENFKLLESANESSLNEFADMDNLTLDQVQDIQTAGVAGEKRPSSDVIFDTKPTDTFEYTEVKLRDIVAPHGLSLAFYKRKELDEDIAIVNRLITAYREDIHRYVKKMVSIVVDENNKILDGLHRYVAMKEVFKPNYLITVYKRKI